MGRQNRRDRWATAVIRAKLPASTRLFLSTVLVKHMKANGQVCHAREDLADEMGVSERTVTRHITRAKNAGWLMPETVSGGYRGLIATYEASFPGEAMGDTSVTLSTVQKRDRNSTLSRDKTVPHSVLMRDTWCPTKEGTYVPSSNRRVIDRFRRTHLRDDDALTESHLLASRREAPTTQEMADENHSSSKVSRHLRAVPA